MIISNFTIGKKDELGLVLPNRNTNQNSSIHFRVVYKITSLPVPVVPEFNTVLGFP